MKLQQVIIKNFMPYKGEQKIDFPQHETQNVMLIFGENMRGKTSFLNSLRWGFYGVALARHLRRIPRSNLINIDAAAENDWLMSVTLKFSHDESKYELRRQITKKEHVSQPKNDSDFEEITRLRINGEVIAADRIIDTINKVMPEEISRFFLFDGELLQEYENLLIDESEQGEKIKEHIEQALGVPALVNGREELKALLNKARGLQAKDAKKNDELLSYAEQQRQLGLQLISLESDKSDLIAQKEDIQTKLEEIEDELKNTEAVQRKKVEIERLSAEKAASDTRLKEQVEEQRLLLRDAWKDVLYKSIEPTINNLRNKRDSINTALAKKTILENKIKEYKESLENPNCPLCKQGLSEQNKAEISKNIEGLSAEAELLTISFDEMSRINSKIDQLSKIKSNNEGIRIIELSSKQSKLEVELIKIETKLDEIEDEIKGYDTDHIMRQRDKQKKLTFHFAKVDDDLKQCKREIDKNQFSQEHISTLISRSAGAQGQLSSRRVNLYHGLEQVFSEGINQLRDVLKEKVQDYASKAFLELTTEQTYSGLEINKNYGLSIIDHQGRVLKERSAGAEQIVALALIDGLKKTARTSGPIIMDTPLGRLDPKHRSNVLKYLPKMAEQVVLLVHEGEINPERDLVNFADRIGSSYKIERISATESRIVKGI